MSVKRKSKDHQKAHKGVELVPAAPPRSADPLMFWTNHPTENTLIDLRPFSHGTLEADKVVGEQSRAFTGRPILISQLAPAIEATCAMMGTKTHIIYLTALRTWWQLLDVVESAPSVNGRPIAKVVSVADFGLHHEVAAHKSGVTYASFRCFAGIVDATRALHGLRPLGWIHPQKKKAARHLIPDDMAREVKTLLKQKWEQVRRTWAVNDKIRAEAEGRARGEPPAALSDEETWRLENWQFMQKVQQQNGVLLPSGQQLLGGWESEGPLERRGLSRSLMRTIAFPGVEEVDIAFHLAVMNSGWNPSTMLGIEATNPFLVADHPKDTRQLVLTSEPAAQSAGQDVEVTLHANKPRAGNLTQYCTGRKTHAAAAPMIVDAYLKRIGPLREIVRQECQAATAELDRMVAAGADLKSIEQQLKKVQRLKVGLRSVWLDVDREGCVRWLGKEKKWTRYSKIVDGKWHLESYLDQVREHLNIRRVEKGLPQIPKITPSDFRDMYARWVYVASKGNILAVMLALGHRRISSTVGYVENNIFTAESDEVLRRWGTHFFDELGQGRIDLTILAQLVRHGPLTADMEMRLNEYRRRMRSRVGAGCIDPRRPPSKIAPNHVAGQLCGTHRCLQQCQNAKFMPESLNGVAMRVEELLVMADLLPRETWLRGRFDEELESGEALLQEMFSVEAVADAREYWRRRIATGEHLIPGLGVSKAIKEAA